MDIQIRIYEGRKVMAGEVEKWKDYRETLVEGGEELKGLVETIKGWGKVVEVKRSHHRKR